MDAHDLVIEKIEEEHNQAVACKQEEDRLMTKIDVLIDERKEHCDAMTSLYYKLAAVCAHRDIDACLISSTTSASCNCNFGSCKIMTEYEEPRD